MCEHEWVYSEINQPNGGYMKMQFCAKCYDVQGSGFISREHEVAYLESLLKVEG